MNAAPPRWREAPARRPLIPLLLLALFAVLLWRTAWLSDDAYVSFRTVRHLLAGDGPRWNLFERVQAFTNPLWTFAMVPATALAGGDVFWPALALSAACSLGAAAVVAFLVARSVAAAALALAVLLASRAFVDYSTSGLENAPAHLLLALLLAAWARGTDPDGGPPPPAPPRPAPRLPTFALLAALLALNRLDHILLALPLLTVAAWDARCDRAALARAVAAFAPLAAWLLFATWYYGAPFPNTAYAKLATGIPAAEYALQGLHYLLDAVAVDPATPLMIGLALAWAVAGCAAPPAGGERVAAPGRTAARARLRATAARRLAPMAGVALYLAYTLKVGGDFMSGRFLAAPLLVAAAALARSLDAAPSPAAAARLALALAALLAGAVAATPRHHLLAPDPPAVAPRLDWWRLSPSRVADERMFYAPATHLFRSRAPLSFPDHDWARDALAERERVVVRGAIGFYGYFAPRDRIILDEMGLSDPFLARLPIDRSVPWRVGHYQRILPEGYLATVATGRNLLADPALAARYDLLRELTQGDLRAPGRLRALWRFHFGRPAATPSPSP